MNPTIKTDNGSRVFHGDGAAMYRRVAPRCDHTLVFDPPWGIIDQFGFMSASQNVLAFCDGMRAADVIRIFGAPTWIFTWDCVSSWYTPNRPLRRSKLCLWYGDVSRYNGEGYLYYDGKPENQRIVKNTRGQHHYRPKDGKMLSDIYSQPITRLHSQGHNHGKPIEWIKCLIANTVRAGSIVIDPFVGGGSTLIACEQLQLKLIGAEIDEQHHRGLISTLASATDREYKSQMALI